MASSVHRIRRVKRLALVGATLGALVAHGTWVLSWQTAKPPGALTTARVTGNLHVITGEGGNVALYVTDEGVVLVDDMFDRNHDDILRQVKQVTDAPVRYVFNTHQHDDHAGGDARMLPIAEVIAHANVRANPTAIKQPYYEDTPGTPIGLPRLTFTDELMLNLGDGQVQAHYFGRGHTRGDAVIYFPRERVIHTGDLFVNVRLPRQGAGPGRLGLPIYVDSAQGGSLIEWSTTLERTLALSFDTVVPGHGPVATKADLVGFAVEVAAMRGRLTDLIREGGSRAEIVTVLDRDYGWRSTGCPPSPPTAGCLQYQQVDALIAELRGASVTLDRVPRGGDGRGRSRTAAAPGRARVEGR